MSLKANLNQLIKEMSPEPLTLDALEKYCHQYKAKLSQAERRLRPSESPNVEGIKKNGAIIAYRWTSGSSSTVEQRSYKTHVEGSSPSSRTKPLSEGAKQFFKDFPLNDQTRKERTQSVNSRNSVSKGQGMLTL